MDALLACINMPENEQIDKGIVFDPTLVKKEPCEEDRPIDPLFPEVWWREIHIGPTQSFLVVEPSDGQVFMEEYSQYFTPLRSVERDQALERHPINQEYKSSETSETEAETETETETDSDDSDKKEFADMQVDELENMPIPFKDRIGRIERRGSNKSVQEKIHLLLSSLDRSDVIQFETTGQFYAFVEFAVFRFGAEENYFDIKLIRQKNWKCPNATISPETWKVYADVRRRIKNRISAKESRKRKADERKSLINSNKWLFKRVSQLESEVSELKRTLKRFKYAGFDVDI
jgi:hypothetical protein